MNSIKNMFSVFKSKDPSFKVASEDALVEKVSEYIKNALPGKKIELTISSPKKSSLTTKILFGWKDKETFEAPDIKASLILKAPLSAEKPSEIAYKVKFSESIKEGGDDCLSFSITTQEKVSKEWEKKAIESEKALCFFEIAEQFSVTSKNTLLSPKTSEKLHSLVSEKLKELHPRQECSFVVDSDQQTAAFFFQSLFDRVSAFFLSFFPTAPVFGFLAPLAPSSHIDDSHSLQPPL